MTTKWGLAALTVMAGIAVVPARAMATQMPYCTPVPSSTYCFYAIDPNDCFTQDGQLYCRTVAFFAWIPA